ncbi:MAG: dihydroorotase family protein [Parcubacteria group bacterium]|jgi:dihydroorotase-like cyclic amidohydrolase
MKKIKRRFPKDLIDLHCHKRDLKQRSKTTVRQTMLEAKRGLISISAAMPNTIEPLTSVPACTEYHGLQTDAQIEFDLPPQYLWFGLTDYNPGEFQKALEIPWILGGKVYPKKDDGTSVTTGTIGVMYDHTILGAMYMARAVNKAIACHCDDPYIIARLKGNPIEAEVSYVRKIISLARKVPGVKIIICHVSCIESAMIILEAQRQGMQIVLELCPHYLWFDADRTNWNPNIDPVFYKCFNNLRPSKHRLFLISLLALDNPLIIISSDNANHTKEEKLLQMLGGLPSNQEMVAVICTLAHQLGLSDEQVANLLSFNASRFLEIPVSNELVEYELEERVDDIQYNNEIVLNPWNGSKLLFPKN